MRVTIVIPHYNTLPHLERTIAGLALQTYPNHLIEVIISDDGSDICPDIASLSFAQNLDIKVLIRPRVGYRIASARNLAIEHAAGDVIICLDADMIPSHCFVESHMKIFERCQSGRVTIGPRKFVDVNHLNPIQVLEQLGEFVNYPDVASVSNHGYHLDGRIPFLKELSTQERPYWFFYTCNVGFMRRDALQIGLFDQEFDGHWGYEDIDFGYRLHKMGCSFFYVSTALAFHQENFTTSAKKRASHLPVNYEKLIAKWPELVDTEPATIDSKYLNS